MPKIIDYDKKKEEIICEAIKVFVKNGYHNTKLSEIAEQCGMGRTTLYQYFKNKDEIFNYVVDYAFDLMQDDFHSIIESHDLSFLDKIKYVASKLTMNFKNKKNVIIILVDLWVLMKTEKSNKSMNRVNSYLDQIKSMFVYLLQEGIKAKEIRSVNVDSMSYTICSLIESYVVQLAVNKGIPVDEQLKNIRLFIDGLST